MSVLSHFLRPLPVSRRAYSVFTKPGGGRYFNSAKPSKVVAQTAAASKSKDPSSNTEVSSSSSGKDDVGASPTVPDGPSLAHLSLPLATVAPPVHPPVNQQDLKLHQFFSLHRPLLTVSQPISSLFESTSQGFSWPPASTTDATGGFNTIDDPPEASPEADADAARLLARAFVVSRVGASLAWEDTLRRLGLDVTEGRAEEVRLAQAEYEVLMDSTKRKRRKKMKKHKLKKRRRLSRAQRVKIGR